MRSASLSLLTLTNWNFLFSDKVFQPKQHINMYEQTIRDVSKTSHKKYVTCNGFVKDVIHKILTKIPHYIYILITLDGCL